MRRIGGCLRPVVLGTLIGADLLNLNKLAPSVLQLLALAVQERLTVCFLAALSL
jgi:uncharacterized membrane protein